MVVLTTAVLKNLPPSERGEQFTEEGVVLFGFI
jgi:hypothetical protein